MKIIDRELTNNKTERVLQKDNLEKVIINDGEIVKYTGYYYKPNISVDLSNTEFTYYDRYNHIETTFIGIVETSRGCEDYHIGKYITTGIYIKPLYILNVISNEWNIIINYKQPIYKSHFLYPHLLMIPKYSYNYRPHEFLDTCSNICNDEYAKILTCSINFDLMV